ERHYSRAWRDPERVIIATALGRDVTCHPGAVPIEVLGGPLVVTRAGIGGTGTGHYLTEQVRVLRVHAGIDHGDGDTLARGDLLGCRNLQVVEVPLHPPDRFRCGG